MEKTNNRGGIPDPWRPSPGDLIQIWDYQTGKGGINSSIAGHGQIGYVIRRVAGTDNYRLDSAGPIFEVICFKDDTSEKYNVWHGWLRQINKTSDIKEVKK